MRKRYQLVAAVGLVAVLSWSNVAYADPDHPDSRDPAAGGRELFPGEGVADEQHGGEEGHLPPVSNNVTLVGKAQVTNPSGAGLEGRVGDVYAHGDYAYLTAFREPTCEDGGVHVIDMADLANPSEVTEAFIPTSPGSYAGEGIQVVPYDNEFFEGDLLIHQNETCDASLAPSPEAFGGISLWDVTEPTDPQPVTMHTGDFTGPDGTPLEAPNDSHSMRVWYDKADEKHYAALIDNFELTDVDILDITDPFNPVMINDTLDLVEQFGVDQEEPDNLTSVMSHDMWVKKVGGRYVMTLNYWDGGYVLLDVTDPTDGNVELVAESDYPLLDEERLARGHEISPEGNAHQSEISPDNRFVVATDEDFDAFRITPTIDTGPYAGTRYGGANAENTPMIDDTTVISGPTTFVGLACEELEPGSGTALVERGECDFQTKLDNITAAGYTAGIVFNAAVEECNTLLGMIAEGTIPYVFVGRTVGLQLLGLELADDPCQQPAPEPGAESFETTIAGIYDGWGYVRLFGIDLGKPAKGGKPAKPGSIEQIDTYTIPEAQDRRYATGFGDLSVHEVAVDPDRQGLAYLSYYAGGLRVIKYGKTGIREVGSFIDEGGNNFWGVEVYKRDRRTYILASDRDFGLYVLRYKP